jgi:hypothetical protein
MALDEIPPDARQAGQGADRRAVAWRRPAGTVVRQERGPGVFARAEEDGVGVRRGLLREGGDVQSTQHDVGSAPAIVIGQLVGPAGGRDVGLDHHQVGLVVEVERFDVLVLERDLIVVVEIAGQRGEAEGREQRVFDRPEERALRLGEGGENELDAHACHPRWRRTSNSISSTL